MQHGIPDMPHRHQNLLRQRVSSFVVAHMGVWCCDMLLHEMVQLERLPLQRLSVSGLGLGAPFKTGKLNEILCAMI